VDGVLWHFGPTLPHTLVPWPIQHSLYYFLKMFEIFSIFISFKSRNSVKENSEYLGIFYFLEMKFENLINYSMNMCWNGQGITTTVVICQTFSILMPRKGKITCGRHMWPRISLCCFLRRSPPTLAYHMTKQTSSTSSLWDTCILFFKKKNLFTIRTRI
jgi:hypothetical protein